MIEKIFILFLKYVLLWPGFGMVILSIINFVNTSRLDLKIAYILLFFVGICYVCLVLSIIKNEL